MVEMVFRLSKACALELPWRDSQEIGGKGTPGPYGNELSRRITGMEHRDLVDNTKISESLVLSWERETISFRDQHCQTVFRKQLWPDVSTYGGRTHCSNLKCLVHSRGTSLSRWPLLGLSLHQFLLTCPFIMCRSLFPWGLSVLKAEPGKVLPRAPDLPLHFVHNSRSPSRFSQRPC